MSVRIDWLQILNRLGSSYDDPFLFVLPNAGRNLLLAMTDRLTWEATFRESGYDFSDWDELQALVAQTDKGLIEGINMDELITAIENGFANLTNALNGLEFPECPDISLQACNSLANGDFPDEPPVTIPEYSTPHPTTPEPTEPSYDEYKCRATHKYLDATRNLIDNLLDLTLQQSPYTWIYDLLTNEEFGNPVYQVLIAIYNFLTSNTYGKIKDDILAAFDRLRDGIMCAIYTSETPFDAMELIQDLIDNDEAGWIVRNLLRMFVIDSTSLDPIWVLDAVDVTGYALAECDCGGLPSGWSLIPVEFTGGVFRNDYTLAPTVDGNTVTLNGVRTQTNAECHLEIDFASLFDFKVYEDQIGIRALLIEVTVAPSAAYITSSGLWASNLYPCTTGMKRVLLWENETGNQYYATDLEAFVNTIPGLTAANAWGENVPVLGDLTEGVDNFLPMYIYTAQPPFTVSFWWITYGGA